MQLQQQKLQQLLNENAISSEDFAYCLGIEPSQAEALCRGKKLLSNRLARQIEQTFSKPAYWLDGSEAGSGPEYDLFG